MKVICESCGTEIPFNKAKNFTECPVCGASFDAEETDENVVDTQAKSGELDEGLMYFDIIDVFENEPEYSNVNAYCKECGCNNSPGIELFDELVDKEYVILKPEVILKCEGCGKEHKPRKIVYKLKDHYAPPLPRCPVCNSVMLKKITKGSKFLAAATLGTFALPYNSKTFECKDCGYRF